MRQIAQLLVLFALFTTGCLRKGSDVERGPAAKVEASRDATSREDGRSAGPRKESSVMSKKYVKPPEDELRRRLSPLEYQVTQHDGTEPPFQNRFHDHKAEGLYVDVVSGEPLFSSRDKFDSGTGWPSFTRPIDPERVTTKTDRKLFMARTEVRSKGADSHLGHVFDDGPAPAGKRYCINSAALRFVAVDRLEAEGYAEYKPLFEAASKGAAANSVSAGASAQNACAPNDGEKMAGCSPTLETAILAGGCFWGMEDILRKVPGVLETEVGYAGGTTSSPNYDQVKTGRTGHAESIRIVFDPKRISYAELLEKWFFRMHDPTTKNRQGNDVGTQYRSAIFATSDEQRKVAEQVKAKLQESGKWRAPIVTEIVSAGPFTPAEDYHQDYLEKHPGGYTCHYMRD